LIATSADPRSFVLANRDSVLSEERGSIPLRQLITTLLFACILAGCASGPAEVVVRGSNTYTIKKEGGTGSSGATQLESDTFREAGEYCAKSGREAVAAAQRASRGNYVNNYYTTEIDFRCIAAQAIKEGTKAAVLECRDRRLKREFKTYRQSAECSNPKILAAYESADYPYMDLVRVLLDVRLVVADNLDKGAITEIQTREQSSEFERRLTSEDQRRRNAAAPQPSADAGSYVLGLNAFQVTKPSPIKRSPAQRSGFACDAVGFDGGLSTTSCY